MPVQPKSGSKAPPVPDSGQLRRLKTLDRVLSKAGLGSRTEARSWIGKGRVRVNGRLIQTPDHWVDLDRDRVTLDGKSVEPEQKVYVLLHKPAGYITSYGDPDGRPTVYDLIQDLGQWVFPVGRLDQDTSGLLLLTNDTALGEEMTNPDRKVPKTYVVEASRALVEDDLDRLRGGVSLSDGPTRPAIVNRVDGVDQLRSFEIVITEGRNRQVRRMVEALDAKVLRLERTRIGGLTLGELPAGKWRRLTAADLASLRTVPAV